MGLFTLPNMLSLLRVPLAAAFLLVESVAVRGVIVVAVMLSDFLDGRIARRSGRESRLGELLDPVTDKLFVFVALSSFALRGQLALWELLLLLARDLYAAAAFVTALVMRMRLRFRSRWSGKVVTTLQAGAVLVLLFWPAQATPLALVVGAAGVWSIIDYTYVGLRSLRRSDGAS